ncbi:ferredoxin [Nocardia brasiliensis]|uniref:Ferredoxin n=1 Tax=Nocardia brasiliensis TaxID=37326 RepID=A0A6G9XU24_NOCBR|nr:ferredoxin [Nocardia brasiliensis]QIS04419.1 ferredoxin [Nocardia brasiliensis]
MKIVADRSRCAGHGMCEAVAPNLFRVGADGVVESLGAEPDEPDADLVHLVVDSCPVEALRITS